MSLLDRMNRHAEAARQAVHQRIGQPDTIAIRADIAQDIATRIRADEDRRVFDSLNDESVDLNQFVTQVSAASDAADASVLTYEALRSAIDRMNHAPGPQEMFDMGGRWAEAYARTRRASRSVKIVREEPTLREIWND